MFRLQFLIDYFQGCTFEGKNIGVAQSKWHFKIFLPNYTVVISEIIDVARATWAT